MSQKKRPDSWKQLFQEVEVVAAVISVSGLSRLDPATGQWSTIGEEADIDSA